MTPTKAVRRRFSVKRLSLGAVRWIAEDIADRFHTNLTPAERRELRALAMQSRDDLRTLATDRDRRRLGHLIAKALTAGHS
jgi:hypothetical protein